MIHDRRSRTHISSCARAFAPTPPGSISRTPITQPKVHSNRVPCHRRRYRACRLGSADCAEHVPSPRAVRVSRPSHPSNGPANGSTGGVGFRPGGVEHMMGWRSRDRKGLPGGSAGYAMSQSADLPRFKYHPDPIGTGSIEPTEAVCECCGEARGYAYAGGVYSSQVSEVEAICPWCIANGSAAREWDATLIDAHDLARANLDASIIEEVTRRTPGYTTWQGDHWLVCCSDACEFHGDAPRDEITALDELGLARLSAESGFLVEDLREIAKGYEPGGSPAFYKFVCRHCGNVKYTGDCD